MTDDSDNRYLARFLLKTKFQSKANVNLLLAAARQGVANSPAELCLPTLQVYLKALDQRIFSNLQ